jgi:hypothetical protein
LAVLPRLLSPDPPIRAVGELSKLKIGGGRLSGLVGGGGVRSVVVWR